MRIGIPAAVCAMVLAPLVHIGCVGAVVDLSAAGDCEAITNDARRELLAVAAGALEREDKWDKANTVCVQGKGRLASVWLDLARSRDLRMRHDVHCSRASQSETWTCNKLRSDFVLQLKDREIEVDSRIPIPDARKIARFFLHYSGPDFLLPRCGGDLQSRFSGKTFAQMEVLYLDPDEGLTVSLGDERVTVDQNALTNTGEVKPVCWFSVLA